MKRYPCKICKEERMFSPRKIKCAKCVRIHGHNYEKGGMK